jgi:hypothetical protein
VGSAVHFDGRSGLVQAPDTGLPLGAAPRTLAFWVRPEVNARVPVIYGDFAPGNAFYVLVHGPHACIGQWGGGPLEVCGTTTVVDGAWHHVALTYDGRSKARLYVDGVLDTSVTKTYITTSRGSVYLGSTVEGSHEYFRGELDEVRVYDRALSVAQIRAMVTADQLGDALVSAWSFEAEALDHFGGNDGVLAGAVHWTVGKVGNAVHFDGHTGVVQAPDTGLPLGAAPRTLAFWVRPEVNARVPVIYGEFAPGDAFYVLVHGLHACIGQWGGGPLEVCGPTNVVDGAWHHVALTYDGQRKTRLYVDGVLDTSVTKTYHTTSRGRVSFGSTGEGSHQYFRGELDEVRVYDRALSATQIRALFRAP